jgi:hypothetical protein
MFIGSLRQASSGTQTQRKSKEKEFSIKALTTKGIRRILLKSR